MNAPAVAERPRSAPIFDGKHGAGSSADCGAGAACAQKRHGRFAKADVALLDSDDEEAEEDGIATLFETMSQALLPIASRLCVVLMQPELYDSRMQEYGFLTVKTCAQFTPHFWQTKPCPETARAVIFVQCGLQIAEASQQSLLSLANNAYASLILVMLLLDMQEPEHPRGDVQEGQNLLLRSGADEVITLFLGESLPSHRITETLDRLELKAQILSTQLAGIQEEAAKEVNAAKLTCRNMQTAWKKQMWRLPGETLVNIPTEDASCALVNLDGSDGRLGRILDYDLVLTLGKGSFGYVQLGRHPQHGDVAVKIVEKKQLKNVGQLFKLDQEFGILSYLPPHQHITRAIQVIHTQQHILFVMNYGGRMNLHDYVLHVTSSTGSAGLPQNYVRSFAEQQALALAHLHGLRVGHRDLKPENFVVSDVEASLQLTDFGLAVLLYRDGLVSTFTCGSLPFCAPEVLRQGMPGVPGYNPLAADCWSLGVNLAELAHGPYSIEKLIGWLGRQPMEKATQIKDIERIAWLLAGASCHADDVVGATIRRLLVVNPEERWKMTDVMGGQGFGMPAQHHEPCNLGVQIYLQDKITSVGISVRPLPKPPLGSMSLLEEVGGESGVNAFVHHIFDWTIMSTVVGKIVEKRPESIPALRALYVEVFTDILGAEVGSARAREALAKLQANHGAWEFNNLAFDTLIDHVAPACERIGLNESTIPVVSERFALLRDAATCAWRLSLQLSPEIDCAAVMQKVASRPRAPFEQQLAQAVCARPAVAQRAPSQWRSPEAMEAHFAEYLRGGRGACSPLPLRGTDLSPAELFTMVELAEMAFAATGWEDSEVVLLKAAVRHEWEVARLEFELSRLSSNEELAREGFGGMAWMALVVQLHQPLASHPSTRCACMKAGFVSVLGQIGEMLSSGMVRDLRRLAVDSAAVGLSHQQFDILIGMLQNACVHMPGVGVQRAASSVRAMRTWAVRSPA